MKYIFLPAKSSVGESFERPAETIEGIIRGALNLLETVRVCLPRARMYNASSSECFGDLKGRPADENTPFCSSQPIWCREGRGSFFSRNISGRLWIICL